MSVRVFLRRKELTPAFRTDRALDELARVRRPEIQADFAALLSRRLILVLGIRLAYLLLRSRPPRGADGRRGADGERRASEKRPARNRLSITHDDLSFMPVTATSAYCATVTSSDFGTCHKMI